MPSTARLAARRGRITTRLEERDDYGIVLFLILATIMTISLGAGAIGQFVGVCLSGFTLLFVLHTSGAHRRTFRAALTVVLVAIAAAAGATALGRRGLERIADAAPDSAAMRFEQAKERVVEVVRTRAGELFPI